MLGIFFLNRLLRVCVCVLSISFGRMSLVDPETIQLGCQITDALILQENQTVQMAHLKSNDI